MKSRAGLVAAVILLTVAMLFWWMRPSESGAEEVAHEDTRESVMRDSPASENMVSADSQGPSKRE